LSIGVRTREELGARGGNDPPFMAYETRLDPSPVYRASKD